MADQRVIDACCGLHPIPTKVKGDTDDNFVPEFTPKQWFKEYYRRLKIRETHLWEKMKAGVNVKRDDNLDVK